MTDAEICKREILAAADIHLQEIKMLEEEVKSLRDANHRLKVSIQLLTEAQQMQFQRG